MTDRSCSLQRLGVAVGLSDDWQHIDDVDDGNKDERNRRPAKHRPLRLDDLEQGANV